MLKIFHRRIGIIFSLSISLLFMFSTRTFAECITPAENQTITINNEYNYTTICLGTYYGVNFTISANHIILDCNASSFIGFGAVSGNGIYINGWVKNITIKNCVIKRYGSGIYTCPSPQLFHLNDSLLLNNTITNCNGACMDLCGHNNLIINNTVQLGADGIDLGRFPNITENNTLTNNEFSNNLASGIRLNGKYNKVIDNRILSNSGEGITLEESSNYSEVKNNIISNNGGDGIVIASSSYHNIIVNNTISNHTDASSCGIDIRSLSFNNTFYLNRFINNTYQACSGNVNNYFNNSFGQGNYWSDIKLYNLDLIDSDNDGIYDSGSQYPYNKTNGGNVTENVTDWHPFVYENGWLYLIEVESPLNKTYNNSWIWGNISTTAAPSWCGYSLDGAANLTLNNDTLTHWYANISSLAEGSHYVTFWCNTTDVTSSKKVYFTIDLTPPYVFNPTVNDTVLRTDAGIQINVSVTDANRNDSAVSVNGVAMALLTDPIFSVVTTPASLGCSADITCTLTFSATDLVGNTNSTTITITTDNTPPTIAEFKISPTPAYPYSQVEITALISDVNLLETLIRITKPSGVLIENSFTGSYVFTNTNELGTYKVQVEARDKAENVKIVEGSFNIYSAPPIAPPSIEVINATGQANVTIPFIAANRSANVTIMKTKELAIREINISVVNAVNNVRIEIRKLPKLPAEVTVEVVGKVYHYINIDKRNVKDGDISKATIKFAVEKAWMEREGAKPEHIVLARWTGSEWQNLTTKLIDETAEEFLFEAESPGLSVFAVIAVIPAVAPPPECPPCPLPTDWSACIEGKQTRTNYRCGPETNYTCQPYLEERLCAMPPVLPKPKPPLPIKWIVLAIIAFVVIIAIIAFLRRR